MNSGRSNTISEMSKEHPLANILTLGANGQIARVATGLFLERTNATLTLYLRNARRLKNPGPPERVKIIEADVLDAPKLEAAMGGQDVVYANLAGRLEEQARLIVQTMNKLGLKRLIFISSMGIYGEVPGDGGNPALVSYRQAAEIIEQSNLDYTILRPAWLNNRDEIDYGTTQKGEPFKNADKVVSRKSVADLVVKLVTTPALEVRHSIGVHKS